MLWWVRDVLRKGSGGVPGSSVDSRRGFWKGLVPYSRFDGIKVSVAIVLVYRGARHCCIESV